MAHFKTAVIGAGASALAFAVRYGEIFGGENLILLERMDRVGKKLASTGNGRGNLSNADLSLSHYHGDQRLAKSALSRFGGAELTEFYNKIGIMLCEEEGKIYPRSFQATSVLDMLLYKINSLGVKIMTEFCVASAVFSNGVFKVKNKEGEIVTAEKLVIASGGSSGGHYGTDGFGFRLAENFGHTLTKTYPSLVQLKCDMKKYGNLRGVKVKAQLTAVRNGKAVKSTIGDLLFTEYGLSGNAVFYISGYMTDIGGGKISVDFLPETDAQTLEKFLTDKRKNCPYLPFSDLLTGVVQKQVGKVILKSVGKEDVKEIVYKLKNFTFEITGNTGFANSQVTKGGVKGEEVDCITFESKKQKGLYLIGEVLDVDGDCGGYNLHFAVASGCLAATGMKND